MRKHWPSYKPWLKEAAVSFYLEMLNKSFKPRDFEQDAGQLLLMSESGWYLQDRKVFFVEDVLARFCERMAATAAVHVDDLGLGLYDTFGISWEPVAGSGNAQLPPVIVTKLSHSMLIHFLRHGRSEAGTGRTDVPEGSFSSGRSSLYLQTDRPFGKEERALLDKEDARLVSAVFGFLIYRYAHAELVVAGFPPSMKERTERHMRMAGVESYTVGVLPSLRRSPDCHYRSGHYRAYRHDRYSRRPDGGIVVRWIDGFAVAGRGHVVGTEGVDAVEGVSEGGE